MAVFRQKIPIIHKTTCLLFFLAISAFLCINSPSASEKPDNIQQLVEQAITSVNPALVRLHVVTAEYYQGREEDSEVFGSGVIIDPKGYLVTNHHVAGKAKRINCILSDKTELRGELVGTDPLSDLAVIKLISEDREFPYAEFADSSNLKVGDRVMAMGSPYALSQSVTMGIVSNLDLVMPSAFWPFNRVNIDGEDVGSLVSWIGHDAAIYRGNSGGPLVNLEGKIVGINEIAMGLSGAIPGNLVQEITQQLIAHGEVKRSWIGLEVQPLLKSSGRKNGALVSGTIEDSPAYKAGFLPGDILLELDRMPVNIRFVEEIPLFNQFLSKIPVGKEIEAVLLRDEKEITLNLTTEKREASQLEMQELRKWGFVGRNLTSLTAKELKRDNHDGILVTGIRPGGPVSTARPRIFNRDIITEVMGETINNIEELAEITEKITRDNNTPVPVLIAFERGGEKHITVVRVGIPELHDSGLEAAKAWIPLDIQVLTRDIAEHLDIRDVTGVRITQVYPDSVAAEAGLEVGDLIVALDGKSIPAFNPEDVEVFPTMVRQYRIGDEVELTILRDSEEIRTGLVLASSPKLPREMKRYRDDSFGFTARDISFQDVVQEKGLEEEGVMVEIVERGSWAALGQLSIGDIIIRVNGQPVGDVSLLEAALQEIHEEQAEAVVFQIRRGIYLKYLEFQPLWP